MSTVDRITGEEARSLLSVLGALLAAYGFFYTGVSNALSEAKAVDWTGFRSKRALRPQLRTVTSARNVLAGLTACAAAVSVLFVPVAIDILADLDPRARYSAEKAALFLLVAFWIGLSVCTAQRAVVMASHLRKGRKKERGLPDV